MPEVQTSTQSGELAQRFVEFVVLQARQASLFLGQFPHPQTGTVSVNLEAAGIVIHQLEMIREKTRGNLNAEESQILNQVLIDLRDALTKAGA